MLEERVDEGWTSGFTAEKVYQTIYGIRYIDDVICRRLDGNADETYGTTSPDKTYYHLTDDQFSTVAIVETNAYLIERVSYDPYGRARHYRVFDFDGDGDADDDDEKYLIDVVYSNQFAMVPITDSYYDADCDSNRNGVVDEEDLGVFTMGSALVNGVLSDPGAGNVFGFSGYVYNSEISTYTVRFRHYDTVLGRWLERDPLGYVDGMNLYEYVGGMPLGAMDPMGLSSTEALRRKIMKDRGWDEWPTDEDGPWVIHHKTYREDGGTDDLDNLEPMPKKKHVELHKQRGDNKRWGKKGAAARLAKRLGLALAVLGVATAVTDAEAMSHDMYINFHRLMNTNDRAQAEIIAQEIANGLVELYGAPGMLFKDKVLEAWDEYQEDLQRERIERALEGPGERQPPNRPLQSRPEEPVSPPFDYCSGSGP